MSAALLERAVDLFDEIQHTRDLPWDTSPWPTIEKLALLLADALAEADAKVRA